MRFPGTPQAVHPYRTFRTLALPALASLALAAAASAPAQAQPSTYNVLIILADDLTRFDLGAYGSKDSRTPAIDGLAKQGMRFTRATQASPMCAPTRQNLYTGLYPTRTGAYPNHSVTRPGVQSVVQRLKPLGYRVALSGKRHFGPGSVYPFEFLDDDSGDGDGPGPSSPRSTLSSAMPPPASSASPCS